MSAPTIGVGRLNRVKAAVVALLAASVPRDLAAQAQTINACYVPQVGAIYLTKLPGLPATCLSTSHVVVSWSDGVSTIPDGSVTTAKLAEAAVTAVKLAVGSVGANALQAGAVTSVAIADGAVTGVDLAAGAVTSAALATGAVGTTALAANAVTSAVIADGAVGSADLAASAVETTQLANGAVTSAKLAPDVTIPLAPESVTTTELANGAVTGPKLAAGAVDHGSITGLGDNDHPQYLLTHGATASGAVAIAVGDGASASGSSSVAIGTGASATVEGAMALGPGLALGRYSTAIGLSTASGDFSIAMGATAYAGSYHSIAVGPNTAAVGQASVAMGSNVLARGNYSVALGTHNDPDPSTSTEAILTVGNGIPATGARSNALTLLRNGDLTISGVLSQNSDARLKMDFVPLRDVLPSLASIRGVTYRFRDTSTHPAGRHMGLIAQEVQRAFPELVHEDSRGYLSVEYGNFTAVLLEAIKEQQAQIENLRERIAQLELALTSQR